MRGLQFILCASLSVASTAAGAETSGEGYQAFDVTRTAARRGHEIWRFDVAGSAVAVNAYGRKARARQFDQMRESEDQRKEAAAFDSRARPALLTVEMRASF